jgi:hypothetical protein
MELKPEISFIAPNELEEAKSRTANIRFDCLVKMFDYGQRQIGGVFLSVPKSLPPQWFKCEMKLTLELVAEADPYTLGMAIKEAYLRLKHHIEQYEEKYTG